MFVVDPRRVTLELRRSGIETAEIDVAPTEFIIGFTAGL
jgi:hypothetical protein